MPKAKNNLQSVLTGWLQEQDPVNIEKGLSLFDDYNVTIEVHDNKTNTYILDVVSESRMGLIYSVIISFNRTVVRAECECPAFEKTSGCKHIVAAAMEILYEETGLDRDDVGELVLTNQQARLLPANSGKVISLFNDHENPGSWQSFTAEPRNAFTEAGMIFGYSRIRPATNKIKCVAENKDEASWVFEFKDKGSEVYSPA